MILAFDPPEKEKEFRSWLPGSHDYLAQQGADLGERLQNAFRFAFRQGFKQVMALGSDTLGLKPDLILEGFQALESYGVVIGPAYDGGYYLIGTSREEPAPFKDIPWSSPEVLETTLSRLKEKNLPYYLLQKLDDLDEAKSLTKGGRKHEVLR